MSVVPPLGSSRWTRYSADSSATGEAVALHVGRAHAPGGDIPVLYFHAYQGTAEGTLTGSFSSLFTAVTSTSYPVLAARLGGSSQWATPDVVDSGGWVDDLVDWAAGQVWIGTRTDRVAVIGEGMGSLNALNWAWRNPGKVLAVALLRPIVDADKFYDDNPSLQATIDADWGSGAAWTAALPDIDPMRNLDAIRPFGHKVGLWFFDADAEVDPADVEAFAELTGATATETTDVDPGPRVAAFVLATARNRASAYVAWEEADWDRFDLVNVTVDPDPEARNTNELTTVLAVGGRRGQFRKVTGSNGNERHVAVLRELTAVDSHLSSIWFQENGGLMVGQQGHAHAVHLDEDDGTYLITMAWGDIFGVSPWIVNMGVWSGHYDDDDLVLLGNTSQTIPGLRLAAGGEVLASERIGGQVTLVVHEADLDRSLRSRTLDVKITGPLGDHIIIGATRLDENHLTYPQAGADILNGGSGSWADFGACYPFRADTMKAGTGMVGRFYPPHMDPPAWDDAEFVMSWTDSGGDGFQGYAPDGILLAHVGVFDPADPHYLQVGPLTVNEL